MKENNLEKLSDLWQTPRWLMMEINKEFNPTIDLAADYKNRKCKKYFSNLFDVVSMYDEVGFMNPPYSKLPSFVNHAWELSMSAKIICLLKVDPSTKWWGIFYDYDKQKPKTGCEIRFVKHPDKNQGCRVKFDPPLMCALEYYLEHGTEKDKKLAESLLAGRITTPAFPSAIVIFDRR